MSSKNRKERSSVGKLTESGHRSRTNGMAFCLRKLSEGFVSFNELDWNCCYSAHEDEYILAPDRSRRSRGLHHSSLHGNCCFCNHSQGSSSSKSRSSKEKKKSKSGHRSSQAENTDQGSSTKSCCRQSTAPLENKPASSSTQKKQSIEKTGSLEKSTRSSRRTSQQESEGIPRFSALRSESQESMSRRASKYPNGERHKSSRTCSSRTEFAKKAYESGDTNRKTPSNDGEDTYGREKLRTKGPASTSGSTTTSRKPSKRETRREYEELQSRIVGTAAIDEHISSGDQNSRGAVWRKYGEKEPRMVGTACIDDFEMSSEGSSRQEEKGNNETILGRMVGTACIDDFESSWYDHKLSGGARSSSQQKTPRAMGTASIDDFEISSGVGSESIDDPESAPRNRKSSTRSHIKLGAR